MGSEQFKKGDIIVEIGNATKWVVWDTTTDYYKCWTKDRVGQVFANFPMRRAADTFVKVGCSKDGRETWARGGGL